MASQEWVTPSEFESLGGKKARKWRLFLTKVALIIGTHIRSISRVRSPVITSHKNSPCSLLISSSPKIYQELSFIEEYCLRGDKTCLKCSVCEAFNSTALSTAHNILWNGGAERSQPGVSDASNKLLLIYYETNDLVSVKLEHKQLLYC